MPLSRELPGLVQLDNARNLIYLALYNCSWFPDSACYFFDTMVSVSAANKSAPKEFTCLNIANKIYWPTFSASLRCNGLPSTARTHPVTVASSLAGSQICLLLSQYQPLECLINCIKCRPQMTGDNVWGPGHPARWRGAALCHASNRHPGNS